ncbi:MAG: hypothetical protein CMC55_07075 [Flavobacteriaceae bacterium]|nr:hypothetical protein [Flavobacteriaceae bacterium]
MKQQVKIYKVKGNPNNPRIIKNDKFKSLKNSIKTLPNYMKLRPVILDEDMMVLGGNMRLKASIDLGKKEIWTDMFTQADCDEMNKIAIEEERETKTYSEYCDEIIIKDNVSSGDWEWDMLANEWDSVQLNDFGLDVWENEDDVKEVLIEDDEIPEVKESKVKLGDVWQLGEHRLMCGDSTSSEDFESLIADKEIDCLFIDPPYQMENKEQLTAIQNACEKIKNGNVLLMTAISSLMELYKDLSTYLKFRYDVIWKRAIPHLGPNLAKPLIFHTTTHIYGKNKFFFNRKNSIEDIDRIRSVIEAKKDLTAGRGNKPIDLMIQLLEAFSNKTILDVFGGNGSTIIACEKIKKNCYCMEIDPVFCSVIIERWEQFTGLKAIKNGTK